jgi:hypothetical protein
VSIAVELAELRQRVADHGPAALLVTVGDDGGPHVVSVEVALTDGALVAGAGRTTVGNVERRSAVTLVWPAPAGSDYCLLVDGAASVIAAGEAASASAAGAQVVVAPSRAVLHRLAGAGDAAGPSCITILDQRPGRERGTT